MFIVVVELARNFFYHQYSHLVFVLAQLSSLGTVITIWTSSLVYLSYTNNA